MYLIIKDIERLFKSYFISYYNKFNEYYDINIDILYFNIEHLNLINDSLSIRMSFDLLINFLAKKIMFYLNKKTISKINLSTFSNN